MYILRQQEERLNPKYILADLNNKRFGFGDRTLAFHRFSHTYKGSFSLKLNAFSLRINFMMLDIKKENGRCYIGWVV